MAAEQQILSLLQQNNKPFNVQSISDWLAQYGIKKTQIQKALDGLVESGKVTAKDFGKTKIYLPPQQNTQVLSKEEADALKLKIQSLKEQLAVEKKQIKDYEQELHHMSSSLTEEQMQQRILELTTKVQAADQKLKSLKSGSVVVTKEERAKVEKDLNKYMDAWRKNRGIFRGIWDTLSENVDRPKAEVFEEMGVETDEAVGVSLSELEKILPKRRKF